MVNEEVPVQPFPLLLLAWLNQCRYDGNHWHQTRRYTWDICADGCHSVSSHTQSRKHENTWSVRHPFYACCNMDRSGVPKKKKKSQSLIDRKGLNDSYGSKQAGNPLSAKTRVSLPSLKEAILWFPSCKQGQYFFSQSMSSHFRPEQKEHKDITEAVFLTL